MNDPRIEHILSLIMQFALGNFNARGIRTEEHDGLDGIIEGLNMLAEELEHDIIERKKAEQTLHTESETNKAFSRLSKAIISTTSTNEITDLVLEIAMQLTESKYGYTGYIDPETGYLVSPTLTRDVWEECKVKNKALVFEKFKGLCGWVLDQRKSLLLNDISNDPRSIGTPPGHLPIKRFLSAPALADNKLIGQIALANKEGEYLDRDLMIVERLADILANAIRRSRMESELRASKDRFHEMAENIQEVFWMFDWKEQRVIYASPAYEKIWRRRIADLYANYGEWGKSIHPEDQAYAEESFAKVIQSGGGEPREYRILRPDGEVRWISDRAFAIRDETGEIVRIAGIAEDITERKRSEEERGRMEKKMQHAQKLESLGVLAGGIAHDFNNLLMAILGNANLALLQMTPEAIGRGYIQNIETTAKRAAELTNQMLAYSGKGGFVVTPINLNSLIKEIGYLVNTVISKKATLRFHFADDLPVIEADASQIRQIVMNLITNASEALADQSGVISISTGVVNADRTYLSDILLGEDLTEGQYVFLEVSDTGSGMDEETQRKVFDPFFTTKFTGRGLGLAAALGIIRGHKGGIKIYSELKRGSSFKVLFPSSGAATTGGERETKLRNVEAMIKGGATVLIADDVEDVLKVAKNMLEVCGFNVIAAKDGQEAVELFKENKDKISLVLLDMTMPRLNGEEAFREMRRIEPAVKVILSSGYNEQDATNRFAGKGLAGFIQKPYQLHKLLDSIRGVLKY